MLNIEQLKSNPPEWSLRVLTPPVTEQELYHYRIKQTTTTTMSVPVTEILGTYHCDYRDERWIDLPGNMQRSWRNDPALVSNPEYYWSQDPKSDWHLCRIAGLPGYYVARDGNHRSVNARFLAHAHGLTHVHGVDVTTHHLDLQMVEMAARLRSLPCVRKVEPHERWLGQLGPVTLDCHFTLGQSWHSEIDLDLRLAEALYRRLEAYEKHLWGKISMWWNTSNRTVMRDLRKWD